MMSNDGGLGGYGLALEICRDGDKALRSAITSTPIVLFDDGSQEIVVGRFELLAAQHRSCGCRRESSLWSTKGRWSQCSLVNQWAVTALSRRLLRFTMCNDTGKVFLQGRGQHATIQLRSQRIKAGLEEWSDRMEIHAGDTIHITPTGEKNSEKSLDLAIVPMPQNIVAAIKLSLLRPPATTPPDSNIGSKTVEQVEPVAPLAAPSVEAEQAALAVPSTWSNRKRKIPETEDLKDIQLFLVPLGQDMSSIRRKMLADKAEQLGARIVDDIFVASHIVVSQQVSTLDEVSSLLGVNDTKLRLHIEENDIPCLLPKWLASKAKEHPIGNVGIHDVWQGDIKRRHTTERRKKQDTITTVKGQRNEGIAEMFRTLANLHQSCPLLESDQWKAYMFRIMAGRLNNLDFEITSNPQTLDRLRKVSGFGSNSVDKIKDYLETGTTSRIEEFKSDPQRVAMKNMMNIWGVGRKTALDLIHRGFQSINDVRTAIQEGGHFLDRNQLVGVECYEDILEEMDRDEVEMIGETVRLSVEEIFPGAQVKIMGSYRRQKATCGDIDVHITHSSYIKKNPELGLSKIVDLLWERGHLLFHLTFLLGMTTGSNVSDYTKSSRYIPKTAWQLSKNAGYMSSKGHDGSSYMGVIGSPKNPGKRRRIDIKFYPWRERIFASLYFTGNGYFNRSMRLWASRKFRFTLNDHGLFYSGTQDRVMEASDEKEVFDKLDLVYKEPHERNCFDAVVSKQGPMDLQLTQADLREDKDYAWVN